MPITYRDETTGRTYGVPDDDGVEDMTWQHTYDHYATEDYAWDIADHCDAYETLGRIIAFRLDGKTDEAMEVLDKCVKDYATYMADKEVG